MARLIKTPLKRNVLGFGGGVSCNNDPTGDTQGHKQPPTIPTARARAAADETAS